MTSYTHHSRRQRKTPELGVHRRPDGAAHSVRPVCRSVLRAVRFEETDPLGLVWHGRYPSYFEDARVMLGNSLGIGYLDFYRAGVMAPVTQLNIDYAAPLRYGDVVCIRACLHYSPAARMHLEYAVTRGETLCCTGSTVQHFTSASGELCLAQPAVYAEFCERWLAGQLVHDLPVFAHLEHGAQPGAPHDR